MSQYPPKQLRYTLQDLAIEGDGKAYDVSNFAGAGGLLESAREHAFYIRRKRRGHGWNGYSGDELMTWPTQETGVHSPMRCLCLPTKKRWYR